MAKRIKKKTPPERGSPQVQWLVYFSFNQTVFFWVFGIFDPQPFELSFCGHFCWNRLWSLTPKVAKMWHFSGSAVLFGGSWNKKHTSFKICRCCFICSYWGWGRPPPPSKKRLGLSGSKETPTNPQAFFGLLLSTWLPKKWRLDTLGAFSAWGPGSRLTLPACTAAVIACAPWQKTGGEETSEEVKDAKGRVFFFGKKCISSFFLKNQFIFLGIGFFRGTCSCKHE